MTESPLLWDPSDLTLSVVLHLYEFSFPSLKVPLSVGFPHYLTRYIPKIVDAIHKIFVNLISLLHWYLIFLSTHETKDFKVLFLANIGA